MSGPWEKYQPASDGPWSKYATETADAPDEKLTGIRGEAYDKAMNYSGKNAVGGSVRGAGSFGATLMAPNDLIEQYLFKLRGKSVETPDRRKGMDEALRTLGADPGATDFKTNKLLTEILGTSGIGGAAGNLMEKMPFLASKAPALIEAVKTSGMSANGLKGISGMVNRVGGGAITGGLSAGAVNPEDAKTGAVIGGAFPAATMLAGKAGDVTGRVFGSRTPQANPRTLQTAKESMDAGYVIPPNMIKPTFKNSVVESISGKQATQQFASTENTKITEKLTRKALGIADDVPLTQGTMENLRKTAGKAYADVSSLSPQAAADLEALKVARNEATGWFNAYNRSASPDHLAKAKDFRALSDELEKALEAHAKAAGRDDLIPALIDARKQIAKTYTVGRAVNDASGTVDARVFGRLYEKGKPLSDGLDVAGKFASAFPKAAISPQQIGSPGAHNLKAGMSALMGGAGVMGAGPVGAAAAALPFIAPPIARSMMFSKGAQQALLKSPTARGLLGSAIDDALPLMYRTNPVVINGLIGQ